MALSRRQLLVVGGGVICGHALGCGGSPPIVLAKEIPAGNKSAIGLNTLTAVGTASVAIARDSNGIYAMSLVCTHEGCDISNSGGGIVSFQRLHCGCHGSEYNSNGGVTLGPSTRPLPHLLVTDDGTGALTIHGDSEVAATDRLPV
jgi:Rieske Fe-S protein